MGRAEPVMDLKALEVSELDTEGLAAVILSCLRGNRRGRPPGCHPGSWAAIERLELAPVLLGLDVENGVRRGNGYVVSYGGDSTPDLHQRVVRAVAFLKEQGLVTRDPEHNSDDYIVPTDAGFAIRIEADPPSLALRRDMTWVLQQYGSGILHFVGLTKEGDECGGTAFWAKPGFFVTCAHNLDLSGWRLEHSELSVTQEHLEERRHSNRNIDLAILVPKTTVLGKLDMAALRLWEGAVDDGETAFVLGYPTVAQRQPTLVPTQVTVTNARDYHDIASLTLDGRVPGGYSGGPVFNERGYVIGVATEETFNQPGGRGEPQNVFGHATPIRYLEDIECDDLSIGDSQHS